MSEIRDDQPLAPGLAAAVKFLDGHIAAQQQNVITTQDDVVRRYGSCVAEVLTIVRDGLAGHLKTQIAIEADREVAELVRKHGERRLEARDRAGSQYGDGR